MAHWMAPLAPIPSACSPGPPSIKPHSHGRRRPNRWFRCLVAYISEGMGVYEEGGKQDTKKNVVCIEWRFVLLFFFWGGQSHIYLVFVRGKGGFLRPDARFAFELEREHVKSPSCMCQNAVKSLKNRTGMREPRTPMMVGVQEVHALNGKPMPRRYLKYAGSQLYLLVL